LKQEQAFALWLGNVLVDFLQNSSGTDVMILKIFLPKNSAKKLAILTLVFEKNTNFFAENWRKSQKIVIITSTPGHLTYDKKDSQKGTLEISSKRVRLEFLCNVW
jgi:hypothetical protein